MPRFLNPFSPGSRDTATNPADVVIPLESAVRVDDKTDRPKSDTESYNDTVAPGTAWTMEALKQSVMADAAVSGIDDIYDRMSPPRSVVGAGNGGRVLTRSRREVEDYQ